MKIACVTTFDLSDPSTWDRWKLGLYRSGFSLTNTLKKEGFEFVYVRVKSNVPLAARMKALGCQYVLKKDHYVWAESSVLKNYARQISAKLAETDSDLVLCLEGTIPVAFLDCRQPIVVWTDAPYCSQMDDYPYLQNLCEATRRNIYQMEKRSLDQCELAIFASSWAAESVTKTYGTNPSKVKVAPWGANVDDRRTCDDVRKMIEARPTDTCKLLFMGINWIRKRGDIAMEIARELNVSGLRTELTVLGCSPARQDFLPSFVNVLGFADKFQKEGIEQVSRVLAESHFIILPSQAEAYGVVLCEANAFGVPGLASNVGGISTIIKDGVNGKLFPVDAPVREYCDHILRLFSHYSDYKALALSSFNEYRNRLNWDVAARETRDLLLGLFSKQTLKASLCG